MTSKKTEIIARDMTSGSLSVAINVFVKRDPWHLVSAYWYIPQALVRAARTTWTEQNDPQLHQTSVSWLHRDWSNLHHDDIRDQARIKV